MGKEINFKKGIINRTVWLWIQILLKRIWLINVNSIYNPLNCLWSKSILRVKCLMNSLEGLAQIPRTHVSARYGSTRPIPEPRNRSRQSRSSLSICEGNLQRTCLNIRWRSNWGRRPDVNFWPTHTTHNVHMHVYTHTQTHSRTCTHTHIHTSFPHTRKYTKILGGVYKNPEEV